MIRHLFKMVWGRRRANLLVAVEMLASFLVLLGVATLALFHLDNLRQPVGFEERDVWRLEVDTGRRRDEAAPDAQAARAARVETLRLLVRALRETPGVEGVALGSPAPFSQSFSTRSYERDGRRVEYHTAAASDELRDVLRLELARGRFFERQDDAVSWRPVVINERLARELFGAQDPLGRNISAERNEDGQPEPERRVVGVLAAYRQEGRFDPPVNYVLERTALDQADPGRGGLLLRVAPGSTAQLEERLLKSAQAVTRGWTLRLEPLVESRERVERFFLAPLLIVGLVAGFLALMVVLGLSGVLWLGVTRRTREIGLRRAKGATAGDIRLLVLGELLVLTSLALLPGLALALQLPLLGLLPVPGAVFAGGLAISVTGLYLLAILCGWYPARLATRVEPAQALHDE